MNILFRKNNIMRHLFLRLSNRHLRTLQLDPKTTYSKADIKRKYAELAKKYHPDICKDPKATEKFNSLVQAYESLLAELDGNNTTDKTQDKNYHRNKSYEEQMRKRAQYYQQYQDLYSQKKSNFYQDNTEFKNTKPIPEWKLIEYLDKLLIVFVILGIILRYKFISQEHNDPANISQRNKLRLFRERQVRTRMLKEFSEAELDKYTLKELIAMENMGIAKIPDETFEDILDNTNVEEFYYTV